MRKKIERMQPLLNERTARLLAEYKEYRNNSFTKMGEGEELILTEAGSLVSNLQIIEHKLQELINAKIVWNQDSFIVETHGLVPSTNTPLRCESFASRAEREFFPFLSRRDFDHFFSNTEREYYFKTVNLYVKEVAKNMLKWINASDDVVISHGLEKVLKTYLGYLSKIKVELKEEEVEILLDQVSKASSLDHLEALLSRESKMVTEAFLGWIYLNRKEIDQY